MTASSFDDTFLNLFPLKSTEDLTSIEQMIMNDKEFEFKMVGLLFSRFAMYINYNYGVYMFYKIKI